MAEPAARRETPRRSAGLFASPCGTHPAAIHGGVAALSRARDYGRTLRGVSLPRVRHGRPCARTITSLGGCARFFRSFRASTQLPGTRRDRNDPHNRTRSRDQPALVPPPCGGGIL